MQPGRVLVYLGLSIAALGLVLIVAQRLGLGRLPGDIVIKRKNFGFYFPIVSSLVVSVILTLLLQLFRR
jgi:hypothetical protein